MKYLVKMWYSPMNNNYFTEDVELFCNNCKQPINKILIHCFEWGRNEATEAIYCKQCYKKINQIGKVLEKKVVLVVPTLPQDAFPVLLRPPVLKDGAISLFEAVNQKVAPADEIVDKTVLAGRKEGSWEGSKVGAPDMKLLKQKDKKLTKKEGLRLLDNCKTSSKVLK